MNPREVALASVERLDGWLQENGWAGHDPFDIRGLPTFIRLHRRRDFLARQLKRVLWTSVELAPRLSRRLLRVEREINAKAMGLFADGYLNLHRTTERESHLRKAEECLAWLDANSCDGYTGLCWGYPFDWQSRVFLPAGTPSSVVTSIVGNAYWNFYRYTKDPTFLSACERICAFFLNDLNIDEIGRDKICFSYTPIDRFHVNNANLFAAEFLVRVGTETGNREMVRQGMRAANYSLGEQNADGSICYWGKDQQDACTVDHFHTGFEIRSLYSIWKATREERVFDAVSSYYRFYLRHLFEDRTIPKMRPDATHPINIHSCAEALLCNAVLSETFPEAGEYVANALRWTVDNMQTEDGWFIFKIWRVGEVEVRSRIPYIRWGQAWMLNGLSKALLFFDERAAAKRERHPSKGDE